MTEQPIVRVRDVMRRDLVTIDGLATVADALALMAREKTSVLLVEKRHADDEIGMVLVSHIANQVVARNRAADRVNVYEIMEKPVITVPADMNIRYCARLFAEYRLVRAPVMEAGQIVGMVSPVNIVLDGFASIT